MEYLWLLIGILLTWIVTHRINVAEWKAFGEADPRGRPTIRGAWTW